MSTNDPGSPQDRPDWSIGFLGLGAMGSRVATNLVRAGFPVTVWNRTQSRCLPLAELGATAANTPRDCAEASDVVFTNLADPSAVEDVAFGVDGVFAGRGPRKGLVDMSTGSLELAEKLHQACSSRHIRFLAAPMGGGVPEAMQGTLQLLCGGDEDFLAELQPVLATISKATWWFGTPAKAQEMKLINNGLVCVIVEALAEAVALMRASGVEEVKAMEWFRTVTMAGMTGPPPRMGPPPGKQGGPPSGGMPAGGGPPAGAPGGGPPGGKGGPAPGPHFRFELMSKDLELLRHVATRFGTTMPAVQATGARFDEARAAGADELDVAGAVRMYFGFPKPPGGPPQG